MIGSVLGMFLGLSFVKPRKNRLIFQIRRVNSDFGAIIASRYMSIAREPSLPATVYEQVRT
jgi:hypothetical protein